MLNANAWVIPVLWVLAAYAALGLAVGVPALLRLAPRADPALRGTPLTVRVLFVPGAVLIWPLAIVRWRRAAAGARA